MKRMVYILLACAIILFCGIPCAAASENSDNTKNELHLEYMEFYNNQEYYKDLARTQGYTLRVSVGSEYEDLEIARINESVSDEPNNYSEAITRGVEIPTNRYNIALWKQYTIKGLSVQSTLYTEKKFYGITDYEVSIYNRYDKDSDLTFLVTPHGFTKSGNNAFYVDPQETVIQYFQTMDKSHETYLEFRAPVSVEGYIKEGTKPE